MSDTPTPPEVGSLWEHESGERRMSVESWFSDVLQTHVVRFVALYQIDGTQRGVTDRSSLSDWNAWAANARRIA